VNPVVPGMTRLVLRATAAFGAVLLLAGCATRADEAAPAPSPSSPATEAPADPADGGLALQVAYTGGFVTPRTIFSRLPLVSVYADGRVISEGPVAAVHPGPALPNLQEARVEPDQVEELVRRALEAGVGRETDYGMPPVADVPSTLITVVTADGERSSEVYALQRGLFPEGDVPGLTEEQAAARAELQDLVDGLTGLAAGSDRPYEPEAVAAVVDQGYGPGAAPDDVATWPGPPLPGDLLGTGSDVSCVVARDEAAHAVLEAAAGATTDTVWQNPDGGRWALSLRPLLPHEDHCADLPTA
jgi:hypothetical protein